VTFTDDMEPSWLLRARREIGTKEKLGQMSNPRVQQYAEATRYGEVKDTGAVPWCSMLACFVMEQDGIRSTRSAAARSWVNWGKPLDKPKPGCIVVLERHDDANPHAAHVGFYVGEQDGKIMVLGGNQSNQVCIRPYPADRVIAYRWPDLS
jgi:uncharacterized protein (TIGR02594 family)